MIESKKVLKELKLLKQKNLTELETKIIEANCNLGLDAFCIASVIERRRFKAQLIAALKLRGFEESSIDEVEHRRMEGWMRSEDSIKHLVEIFNINRLTNPKKE